MEPYFASIEKLFDDVNRSRSCSSKNFSRKIFMYWNSGLIAAPDIVYLSFHLAKVKNPDYEVIFLDAESIERYFPYRDSLLSAITAEIKEAHFSDILRTYLLLVHGGVWIDASCFVTSSFSSWLEEIIEQNEYFIGRSNSFYDRRIMNWFIASKSGNITLSLVLRRLLDFFMERREMKLNLTFSPEKYCASGLIGPDETDWRAVKEIEKSGNFPYFIYHYTWNEVMKSNVVLQRQFSDLPDIRVPVVKLNRRLFSDVKFIKERGGNIELDRSVVQSNADLPPIVRNMILTNFQ